MDGIKKTKNGRIAEVYAIYPRKLGKSAGMKKAMGQCKTMAEVNKLEIAVKNYIAHITREGTEPKFILYWSTFLNGWRDWLDPETGTTVTQKLDLSGIKFE